MVLRHEVYPKFVARVMERSRHAAPVTSAAAAAAPAAAATRSKATRKTKTKKKSFSGTSSLDLPAVPIEKQRVSWSASDEVSQAVRAELAKCYF